MRFALLGSLLFFASPLPAGEPQKVPLATDDAPPPPPPAQPPASGVPDAAFSAMRDQQVSLILRGGQRVNGRLIAFQPDSVTLIRLEDNTVVVVPRAEITTLQAAAPAAPAASWQSPRMDYVAPPPPIAPNVDRHFGIMAGAGPIVVALDADYRPFYGFVSSGLALPLYLQERDRRGAVSLGLGGSWRLRPSTNWQIDIFGHATFGFDNHYDYSSYNPSTGSYTYSLRPYGALGLGVGFHYTMQSGFTVGFKIPVIGGAFGGPVRDAPSSGAYYYLATIISFPLATIGYRF